MSRERLRQFFLPGSTEQDELFNQEILRLSHLGLGVIAAIEIIVPLFAVCEQHLLSPEPGAVMLPAGAGAALILLGALTGLVWRLERSYPRARRLAWISGWLAAAILVAASLGSVRSVPGFEHTIPGRVALVLLVLMAVVPFRPLQVLALGLSLGALFWSGVLVAGWWGVTVNTDPHPHAVLLTLTLLATVLTGLVYSQRFAGYQVYMQVLQASQELRMAQSQGLQSENAVAMGRLAAAISHEMNTPLGALKSGVETLLVLSGKLARAPESQRERYLMLQADLYRSIKDSAARLEEIVGRLQRFTNLDRAEVQSVDLNQMLRDVSEIVSPPVGGQVRVELALKPVPPIICYPQQLSGVFSNLLQNAISASEADSVVEVSTQRRDGEIEVAIRDHGRGIAPQEVGRAFEPGFKVSAGRVAAGNWSLFQARQVVRSHGGEIRISNVEGGGTMVRVSLPCEPARD